MKKSRIDKDLDKMTVVQLRDEVLRLRRAFRLELEHTGNHRCWINLLRALPEGKSLSPLSLPRAVFLGNCKRYFDRNQLKQKRQKSE